MPVTAGTLATWIEGLNWQPTPFDNLVDFVRPGPFVPDVPDRLIVVTLTGGLGYQLEGMADQSGFQARVRGMQSASTVQAYSDAESLAFTLDTLIFNAGFPAVIADTVIILVTRAGGPPEPLAGEPDDADRYTFVCNYSIEVGN